MAADSLSNYSINFDFDKSEVQVRTPDEVVIIPVRTIRQESTAQETTRRTDKIAHSLFVFPVTGDPSQQVRLDPEDIRNFYIKQDYKIKLILEKAGLGPFIVRNTQPISSEDVSTLPAQLRSTLNYYLKEGYNEVKEELKWKVSVEKPIRNGSYAVVFECNEDGQVFYKIIKREEKKLPRTNLRPMAYFKLARLVHPGIQVTSPDQKTTQIIPMLAEEVQTKSPPILTTLLENNVPYILYPQRASETHALQPLGSLSDTRLQLRAMCAFAYTLSCMHEQRCYHLNLRPEVFSTFNGAPRLLQVEGAQHVPAGCFLERTGPILAPQYTAPECHGKIITDPEKADMFAFGVCLIKLLFKISFFRPADVKSPELMRKRLEKERKGLRGLAKHHGKDSASIRVSRLAALLARLVSDNSKERPTAEEAFEILELTILDKSGLNAFMLMQDQEKEEIQKLRKG